MVARKLSAASVISSTAAEARAGTAGRTVAVNRMSGMDMGLASTLGSFPFFLSVWLPMMLPGVASSALRVAAVSRRFQDVTRYVARVDGEVYLTYSSTARRLETVMVYYGILDRVSKGRNEGQPTRPSWIRRRDEFG